MTRGDAEWWDEKVGSVIATMPERADRRWRWRSLLPLLLLVQLSRRRRCRPLLFWAATDNGKWVRAAIAFVVERYPHLDVSDPGLAHYLWYMSAAPDQVLANYGVSDPPALGEAMIDACMALSESAGLEGRIGLHAHPVGGEGLLHYYESRCRLLRLPATLPLPVVLRRNDGRFFYADARRAAELLESHDNYR